MSLVTPFLAGWHRHLFGSPPRPALAALRAAAPQGSNALHSACREFIPDRLLPRRAQGLNSRTRRWTPVVTFWAFLAQVLAGTSCREAVCRFLAGSAPPEDGAAGPSTSTAAYCRARARLDLGMLQKILAFLTGRVAGGVPRETLWLGHPVRLVDGSTASMPDTAANQKAWPQSPSQKPGCGFPYLKMVGLFCLQSGALLQRVYGSFRVSEQALARQLWPLLEKGSVLLGDRGFCSYLDCSQLRARGVEAVLRLHATRRTDFRQGRRLGRDDRLLTWTRTRRDRIACTDAEYAALPATLLVRYVRYQVRQPGFRTQQVVLATSLLDPVAYPVAALAALYRRRWQIELHWRECKTTLRLDVLRCRTPDLVERELLLHAIAYNLLRAWMQQAAVIHHCPLTRLSCQGTLDTVLRFAEALHPVAGQPRRRAALWARCLEAIAADRLPERPGRVEPRVLKRRPKSYDWLNTPRHQTTTKRKARRRARLPKTLLS